MSTLSVTDLHYDCELDSAQMSVISGGGGAPWVYGWITPFVSDRQQGFGGVVNIYDITNNFTAGQMINQFQSVDVRNSGDGANLTVTPNAISANRAG
ncbi:hypothetical protein [Caballeronia sp. Lep1P3]|uniref:hypothetical protein n=1 Tax=Caballeronia sp. Lep1P3 TaxID=2878150 RepID=UPI001FD1D860|nr:hypothetical protein [Caballeronia sp. Lep1P3]